LASPLEKRRTLHSWTLQALSSNFTSYFDTGYMIRAEGHKDFNSHYVTVYTKVDEQFVVDANDDFVVDAAGEKVTGDTNSSCNMFGKWDWSKEDSSNMWSTSQQVYNATDRPKRNVQHRKLKVRGSGPALQLHFESETGKPFHIIGWSTSDTSETKV
jgi:hypothetical protein